MTAPDGHGRPAQQDTVMPSTGNPSRWVLTAVPAAAFVIGLVLGGSVVGVGLSDNDPSAASETTPSPTAPEPTSTSDVTVVVPNACLEAARTIDEALELIRGGADSVRDFEPEELVQMLNELEDLDNRATALSQQCSDQGEVSRP
jgi:hypothetical protein